jgi:hypothetical protein
MDTVYDRLGINVVLGFEVDLPVPTPTLLERLSRVTVCTVSLATEDVDSVPDVERAVAKWVVADATSGIHCIQLSVKSTGTQFLLFVWAHRLGDAEYVLHHIAGVFDTATLQQTSTARGTHPSYGSDAMAYLYKVAVSLLFSRVPIRTLRDTNSFRLMAAGSTDQWTTVARSNQCSINDVFVWLVKEAVSQIEGSGPAVIAVVRNHRTDFQEPNAHTHGMVVLPSTLPLRYMPSHTNGVKRCGGVLHPFTRALATGITTRLFTRGEQCTTMITSNVRVPWVSATFDHGKHTVRNAFVTTLHDRSTVHLTSMNGLVNVCASSRWSELDRFCSTLSDLLSAVLGVHTSPQSTL